MTIRHHDAMEVDPSLRHIFINLRTMEPRLRLLLGVVTAQLAASAILIALHDAPWPIAIVPANSIFGPATVPLTHYIFCCVSFFTALALFTYGLMSAGRPGIIGILSCLGIVLGVRALSENLLTVLETISVVAVMGLWCMALIFAHLTKAGYLARQEKTSAAWLLRFYFLTIFCLVSATVVYFLMVDPTIFGFLVLLFLSPPLSILFGLASIEWAEIIDTIVRRTAKSVDTGDEYLLAAGSLISGLVIGFAVFTAYKFGFALFARDVGISIASIAALALLLRIARFEGTWDIRFPWAALAIFVGACVLLSVVLGMDQDSRAAGIALLTLLMAFFLCICGRQRRLAYLAPTALFSFLVALSGTVINLFDQNLISGSDGVVPAFDISVTTLLITIWAMNNRKEINNLRPLLWSLLVFNCSLILIFLIGKFYESLLQASSARAILEAFIFFIAVVWEVLISGGSITNIDSEWFPRKSRIYLFVSFVVLTLTFVLFWGSAHGWNENLDAVHMLETFRNPESTVWVGLIIFAPAMLWTLFVLRLGKWLATQRGPSS